ncbi:uncharacterized protein LOC8273554 [Ricinus communis]|uniref:FAS1 domain-containing protein n=1 Tax=Ricinus communis TaxID=3988 RepID=B9T0D0_RICCO|nr:uncharacterized protein LOC8273554 [Ricinus communis]EEF30690.1 conserved hypothetical protein [Ricinus communis]|eukprot:XP_002531699.1 uncharacterized protein LOC8273554 [Ricinus communis]
MALWFLVLLPIFTVVNSQPTTTNPTPTPINQTDLQVAMDDMRTSAYHGFVILLKILNGSPNSLRDGEITFLMPSDEELSKVALRLESLQDFILGHSIPTALLISHLLHFPNGTLVPTGVPNRMLRVTNGGRTGLFVNNARVVSPNVCLNSLIRCHGISAAMIFRNGDNPTRQQQNHPDRDFMDSAKVRKAKSPSRQWKRSPALH